MRADTDVGMNRGIYATGNGMMASQHLLEVISQNLANLSTNGYKRDGVAFNDAFLREMRADGGRGPRLGSLGSGAVAQAQFVVFEPGPIRNTGNDLDVAIRSAEGAFAVRTPQGVAYTRDGAFTRNQDGMLVTRQGYLVLDPQLQPIDLSKSTTISIGSDGTIEADGLELGRLGVFSGTFAKRGDNLFSTAGATPIAQPDLQPQAIEDSNVNAVESMVAMIQLGRSFEMAQRSMTQQDELTQKLIQSLQG